MSSPDNISEPHQISQCQSNPGVVTTVFYIRLSFYHFLTFSGVYFFLSEKISACVGVLVLVWCGCLSVLESVRVLSAASLEENIIILNAGEEQKKCSACLSAKHLKRRINAGDIVDDSFIPESNRSTFRSNLFLHSGFDSLILYCKRNRSVTYTLYIISPPIP